MLSACHPILSEPTSKSTCPIAAIFFVETIDPEDGSECQDHFSVPAESAVEGVVEGEDGARAGL